MYTTHDIEMACIELAGFVHSMANNLLKSGWSYTATSNAPESFKELKETTVGKHILVANYGCDSSIYLDDETNILFRFWHDVHHLELDVNFSKSGEYQAISKQLEQGLDYGLSNLALTMLYYDTIGQVEYYFKHKQFVNNQYNFCKLALGLGLTRALDRIV